jgi:hypothetical protein
MEEEVQKLRRQNARLTEDLRKAHSSSTSKKSGCAVGEPHSGAEAAPTLAPE